jgi:hypothetical protein
MDGPVKGSKGRLLATNVAENQLLAFDAKQHGKFAPGDGKAGRYFMAGFTKADDYLSWPIRLNDPATFDVSVRYSGGTKGEKLGVQAGDQLASGAIESESKTDRLLDLGKLKLAAGEYELHFKPEKPGEVSLFEVVLKPAR